MKCDVLTLENKKVGSIDLADGVFGSEVRKDIISRMVNCSSQSVGVEIIKLKTLVRFGALQRSRGIKKGQVELEPAQFARRSFVVVRPYSDQLSAIMVINFHGKFVEWLYVRRFRVSKQRVS